MVAGFTDVLNAFSFLRKNNMRWVFLIPIAFSCVMVLLMFSFSGDFVEALTNYFMDVFHLSAPEKGPEEWLAKIGYWLKIMAEYTIFGVLYLLCYLLFFKVQKYIVLIFMAPFIAWISEKAEEKIMGNTYEFRLKLFLKDTWRGIRIAIKNLFLELIVLIILGIVISSISAIAPPMAFMLAPFGIFLSFLVSAYYYGYSSFDYLNERNRLTISQGNRLIWNHKPLVTGNGIFFGLMMRVPFLGIVLAPVLCPVGAVISSNKMKLHKKTA